MQAQAQSNHRFDFKVESVQVTCSRCGKVGELISMFGIVPTVCTECALAAQAEQDAAAKRRRFEERMETSGIPPLPLQFPPVDAEVVKSTLEGGRGLYLWGPTGTGKTVMATHVARQFLERDVGNVYFVMARRLVLEAQSTYSPRSAVTPLEYADRLSRVSLLVVDDFGRQKASDDAKQIIFDVVDQRCKFMRKTVFTSEFSLSAIEKVMDAAFAGRIAESCAVVNLNGRNLRLPDMTNRGGQE